VDAGDVIDVQAQVTGAVVAGSRRGREPLHPVVLEQLDEPTARDPQVDRPDVVELETEDGFQIWRV